MRVHLRLTTHYRNQVVARINNHQHLINFITLLFNTL